MSSLFIRQFRARDAEAIVTKAIDPFFSGTDWKKQMEFNVKAGPAYTGVIDGEIVGCAGILLVPDRPEVGQIWAVYSRDILKHKKTVFRATKDFIKILTEEFHLTSLITNSKKGFPASQRLLEHLGFTRYDGFETDTDYYYIKRT